MATIPMTKIIRSANKEYRYGVRIVEICYEEHTFTVLDESEGWTSLEQAKRYADNTLEMIAPSVITTEDGWELEDLEQKNIKHEAEIYRYKITVENLCGTKWTNIVV